MADPLEITPCDFADAIAALCECDEPCDLCVERDGECQRGDDCKCKNGEIALPGW